MCCWSQLNRCWTALCVAFVIVGIADAALALEDGLARIPPMGWNSWNQFQLNINEALIRSTADAIATNGMKKAGYQYVIVDAGWKAKQRAADGKLSADPSRFPSGMNALGDYIHRRGLKFGLYTDAGGQDCVAGTPGSRDHEQLDAQTFAEWGVDYLKEDWCHTEGMNAQAAYTKMHDALRTAGRPIVFSVCEWGDNQPWNWAPGIAHLWRTTGDIKDCWDCGEDTMRKPGGFPRGWTLILDAQAPLHSYAGPGHWNDPDILVVGLPGLTLEEARAHFSLWCILAAPLICGCDLTRLSPEIARILLNPEVVAVDQDALGVQGTCIARNGLKELWSRALKGGGHAVVLFNRGASPAEITVYAHDLDFRPGTAFKVRDLWERKNLGRSSNGFSAKVPARGSVMLRLNR